MPSHPWFFQVNQLMIEYSRNYILAYSHFFSDWIVSDVAGDSRFGLMRSCLVSFIKQIPFSDKTDFFLNNFRHSTIDLKFATHQFFKQNGWSLCYAYSLEFYASQLQLFCWSPAISIFQMQLSMPDGLGSRLWFCFVWGLLYSH